MAEDLDQVERSLKRAPKRAVADEDLLSTGSTLLNLALSGRPHGGFAAGRYYFMVGDSSSGKTFLSATCLAEALLNPRFRKHRLIYRDCEGGATMLQSHFGTGMSRRAEHHSPHNSHQPPATMEDFYDLHDAAVAKGPVIDILDSENSLPCRAELRALQDAKAARKKGEAEGKSYGTEKAKVHSARLRSAVSALGRNGSILIIIAQTRDRIGPGALYDPRTRSGGNALTFYATSEIWTSVGGSLKKSYKGKELANGILVKAKVKKTRLSGRVRTVWLPLYWDSGLDDLGGCVDYLVQWQHWKKTDSGVIDAIEFGLKARRDELVTMIEGGARVVSMEDELRALTARVWQEIEQALVVKRKKRYV